MKIAIVGAGALGCVYGLRLARAEQVTLVVRDLARAPTRIFGQRVSGAADVPVTLPVSLEVPDDAEVILVTVRVEQLTDELLDRLARTGPALRIVVTLTPLLPQLLARASETLGDRLVVGMPGVVAYEPEALGSQPKEGERNIRYWTPSASPTALEDRLPTDPLRASVLSFREALVSAGFPCEVMRNVRSTNPATTIAFLPLLLSLQAAGGSIQKLLDDRALLALGLAAGKEAQALAKTVGELARFSSLFFSFATPFTVRAGIKLARSRAPEAIAFLEQHFGAKLRSQHDAMLTMILELAQARGMKMDALERLARAALLTRSPSAPLL